MNIKKWLVKNTESLKGKTVAITGATGSIGSSACEHFACLGTNLILLDRNMEKSLKLKNKLLQKYSQINIKNIQVDMQDINSVKNMCEQLCELNFDYLILNAGAYKIPQKILGNGYNNVFNINFISPYFIIKFLLKKNKNFKTIIVGSIAHKFNKINIKNIDFSNNKQIKIYGNSKRFLMFACYELFKNNIKNLAVVHPGICYTNITSGFHKSIMWFVKIVMKIIFIKPQKASLNLVLALFKQCDYKTWIGPRFFNIWGKPKLKKLNSCKQSESKIIFEKAEKIYNKIDD